MNILSKLRVPFVALVLGAAGSAGAAGECSKGLIPAWRAPTRIFARLSAQPALASSRHGSGVLWVVRYRSGGSRLRWPRSVK